MFSEATFSLQKLGAPPITFPSNLRGPSPFNASKTLSAQISAVYDANADLGAQLWLSI